MVFAPSVKGSVDAVADPIRAPFSHVTLPAEVQRRRRGAAAGVV